MFPKRNPDRRDCSQALSSPDAGVLFARYDRQLRDRVRALVNTSEANIEDACMFAWVQLLRHELDELDAAYSWLRTVAVREAVKLDRGDRRTRPLPVDEHGVAIEPVDTRDQLAARDMLAHAGAIIHAAGLSTRQREMISLQLSGLTYQQIAARTGDSPRTVERQILRARAKLTDARNAGG